jgi:hypothetical protein
MTQRQRAQVACGVRAVDDENRGGGRLWVGPNGIVWGGDCLICFEFKFKMISNQIKIILKFD